MKLDRKFSSLGVATIALAVTGEPITRAQNDPSVATASTSTVAVAGNPLVQRHWQNFMKLAAKPSATVTLKDFENAF